MLGINELKGGRNFILKRFVEMEEEEIADKEKASKKYPELDEGVPNLTLSYLE